MRSIFVAITLALVLASPAWARHRGRHHKKAHAVKIVKRRPIKVRKHKAKRRH